MQHVWPTWTASPAGSGTVDIQNAGEQTWTVEGVAYSCRNYTYTATPAAGYEFVRFDGEVDTLFRYGSTTRTNTLPFTETSNPFTSNSGPDVGFAYGASYWEDWHPSVDYDYSTTAIRVVAVFRLVRTGLLVYMPANGQLVYDPNRNGALVYDG